MAGLRFRVLEERIDGDSSWVLLDEDDQALLAGGPFPSRDGCLGAIRLVARLLGDEERLRVASEAGQYRLELLGDEGTPVGQGPAWPDAERVTAAREMLSGDADDQEAFEVELPSLRTTKRTLLQLRVEALVDVLERYDFSYQSRSGLPGFELFQNASGESFFCQFNDLRGQALLYVRGFRSVSQRNRRMQAILRNGGLEPRYEQRFEQGEEGGRYYFILKGRNGLEIARSRWFAVREEAVAACLWLRSELLVLAAQQPEREGRRRQGQDRYDLELKSVTGLAGFELLRGPIDRLYYFLVNGDDGVPLLFSQGYRSSSSRDHAVRATIRLGIDANRYETLEIEGRWYLVIRAANFQEVARSAYFASREAALRVMGWLRVQLRSWATLFGVQLETLEVPGGERLTIRVERPEEPGKPEQSGLPPGDESDGSEEPDDTIGMHSAIVRGATDGIETTDSISQNPWLKPATPIAPDHRPGPEGAGEGTGGPDREVPRAPEEDETVALPPARPEAVVPFAAPPPQRSAEKEAERTPPPAPLPVPVSPTPAVVSPAIPPGPPSVVPLPAPVAATTGTPPEEPSSPPDDITSRQSGWFWPVAVAVVLLLGLLGLFLRSRDTGTPGGGMASSQTVASAVALAPPVTPTPPAGSQAPAVAETPFLVGSPAPAVAETPSPAGSPAPAVAETPSPAGSPAPAAAKTPSPAPGPAPAPARKPSPAPGPAPAADKTPSPAPGPTPAAAITPSPAPGPAPAPARKPSPPVVPSIVVARLTAVAAPRAPSTEKDVARFLESGDEALPHTFVLNRLEYPSQSHAMNAAGKAQVQRLAQVLKRHPEARVRIVGHNDGTEDEHYTGPDPRGDSTLSQLRAHCVYRRLIFQGVAEDHLEFQGVGSGQPVAGDGDEVGRQRNRRVELVILSR